MTCRLRAIGHQGPCRLRIAFHLEVQAQNGLRSAARLILDFARRFIETSQVHAVDVDRLEFVPQAEEDDRDADGVSISSLWRSASVNCTVHGAPRHRSIASRIVDLPLSPDQAIQSECGIPHQVLDAAEVLNLDHPDSSHGPA